LITSVSFNNNLIEKKLRIGLVLNDLSFAGYYRAFGPGDNGLNIFKGNKDD